MKKTFFLIILILGTITAFAQTKQKVDSLYYLIDTANIPKNARLWDIHEEYPSLKAYVIQCPCLRYGQEPMFVYDTKEATGQTITEEELNALKLTNLSTLILKAKQFTATDFKGKYIIFLGEPIGKNYIFHKVRLLKPIKSRGTTIDYENIPADKSKTTNN
jgi:hypothetical protein